MMSLPNLNIASCVDEVNNINNIDSSLNNSSDNNLNSLDSNISTNIDDKLPVTESDLPISTGKNVFQY